MLLTLKNIGKIQTANIELNGITVIAGENNTGKSTVGKVLYSVFNSFYRISSQIERERTESVRKILEFIYPSAIRTPMRGDSEELARNIVNSLNLFSNDKTLLEREIRNNMGQYDKNSENTEYLMEITASIDNIQKVLNVSDEDIFRTVLSKTLNVEFDGQINNIFIEEEGTIELKIKGTNVSVSVKDNGVEFVKNKFSLNTQVVYVDDPFVLDDSRYSYFVFRYGAYMTHRDHLRSMLFGQQNSNVIEEILTSDKLESIYSRINPICNGSIIRDKRSGLGYKISGTEKVLNIRNLSTGLKAFVILKTLLQNGILEEKGTIVLDEPEIHLHPAWQLLFAELIVLLQKEFNMHILLTTHSPYFLQAIEVYSAKYEIADKCRYYLSSVTNDIARIDDVSANVELIYQKLARPLQDLENERYNND